jgi:WD40 repeat protein
LSSSQNSAIVSSSASMYLAAADDAGKVRFMDTNTIALDESSLPSLPTSQILHHDPNGVAVVPTCAFRPGSYSSRSLELASGGTDCKIHLWDILKPR